MDALLAHFHGFVADLTTVEKRNIVALTEIARDALQTQPQAVPSLAGIIIDRVLQVPAHLKLPVLYLLDSIVKTVGEPYISCFVPSLPEVFSNAWTLGAPGLHRSLDKLLVTWTGVFPPATLDAVRARLAAPQPAPQPANGGGAYGYGPMHAHTEAGPKPMMQDPRLMGPPQTHYPQQHPPQHQYPGGFYDYGMPQPVHYPGAPPPVAYPPQQQHLQQFYPPPHAQPQPMVPQYHGYASPPSPQQQQQGPPQQSGAQAALPDLLSSLLSSGLLAGGAAAPAPSAPQVKKDQPAATVGRGFPASVEFAADRIKESNPAALRRLLAATEATKKNFLDRKFLRRQKHSSGLRMSRMWFVDLDTWMAGSTNSGAPAAAQGGAGPARGAAPAAAAAAAEPQSVPADEDHPHCALSGERFEQYWDETYQEWRYRDTKRLGAEEAAAHGLKEGALVLVSALGAGNGAVVQGPSVGIKRESEGGAGKEAAPAAAVKEESPPPAKRLKVEGS